MKVVILAGGAGTRIREGGTGLPKPLAPIGGRPILWHVMRLCAHFGFDDFVIALGADAEQVRHAVEEGALVTTTRRETTNPWSLELVDTGEGTANGGRVKRLRPHLGERAFMLMWCDGLADIDLSALHRFHEEHGRLATVTAVHPPARFGLLELDGDRVRRFAEKPAVTDQWINGAFFVLEPGIFDYIDGDETSFEHEVLARLAADGQLMAYRHGSFWQCMDTEAERQLLDDLWCSGRAPWKLWD